jgi:hypothetical protein
METVYLNIFARSAHLFLASELERYQNRLSCNGRCRGLTDVGGSGEARQKVGP